MNSPGKAKVRRHTNLTPKLDCPPGERGEPFCGVTPSPLTTVSSGKAFPKVTKPVPSFKSRNLLRSGEQLPPTDEEPITQHQRLAGY